MSKNDQRGGRRPGAGRPRGQGPYGEATRPLRVPVSLVDDIRDLLDNYKQRRQRGTARRGETLAVFQPGKTAGRVPLPLYSSRVPAGFPSPADDYLEDTLDLNEHLVRHPAATFLVRVSGESMLGAGIHPDDVLVVDRSLEPVDGKIVIAVLDGELTVKRFRRLGERVQLHPENPAYPVIEINEEQDFRIWGVVTSVIHKV